MPQQLTLSALLSILAAGGSFLIVCMGHPVWGLVAALISLPLGLLGVLQSSSPRLRGGFISVFAIILGVVGVLFSILGILGKIAFWLVQRV